MRSGRLPWYQDWYWREKRARERRERTMSSPEVVTGELVQWEADAPAVILSKSDLELIRRQVPVPRGQRGPSDVELDDFGRVCMARRLDPFDRQIYLANFGTGWRPYIGVHGRLVIALRSRQVEGMEGPFFCAKREGIERAQPPNWDEVWDDPGPPHAAKFVVYRKGWTRHPVGVALWSYYGAGKTSPAWTGKPALMLSYKAITRALNLVFPDVMPPEPDRELDVDESVGYVRGDSPGGTGTGADVAEGSGPAATPRPDPPSSFIVPSQEQVERVIQLRDALGLGDADARGRWIQYVSDVMGRVVGSTTELGRDDTAHLIDRMEADVADGNDGRPLT